MDRAKGVKLVHRTKALRRSAKLQICQHVYSGAVCLSGTTQGAGKPGGASAATAEISHLSNLKLRSAGRCDHVSSSDPFSTMSAANVFLIAWQMQSETQCLECLQASCEFRSWHADDTK